MREKRYEQLIHLLVCAVAVLLWFISVQFSVDGFGFILPKYKWMGYLLALSITVIELVFNEEGMKHSLTVVAIGILSYLYGIMTNVIGIWAAQGSPDAGQNPFVMLFPVVLGFFLEVAPEPLFIWGILGTGARDLLGHFFGSGEGGREAYD